MNPSLIWGTALVIFGLSLILKSLFNIAIPLVRPFIGCVLVYLGLHIMMDPFNDSPEKKTVIFGKSVTQARDDAHVYNVVFGGQDLDVTNLGVKQHQDIAVNTVFGTQKIIIDPHVPTKIRVNAIFARASLPDETLLSFGRNVYTTTDKEDVAITIHINAVFANVDVVLAQHEQDVIGEDLDTKIVEIT